MTFPERALAAERSLITEPLTELARSHPGLWRLDSAGVTPLGRPLQALVHADAYDLNSRRLRVLMLGGITGRQADVRTAHAVLAGYAADSRLRGHIALSGVAVANPEALSLATDGMNSAGGVVDGGFPPEGGYFNDPVAPEARYLWRWILFQAPDLVIDLRSGSAETLEVNAAVSGLGATRRVQADHTLVHALGEARQPDPGAVPAIRLTVPADGGQSLDGVWSMLGRLKAGRSGAGEALHRRQRRSAGEVASTLARRYGDRLEPVVYTQGVAISGRLRVAQHTGDVAPVEAARRLVEPYVSGARPPFSERAGGQDLAGVVWCEELLALTGDDRYRDLMVKAADRFGASDVQAPPPPADPDFRTEDMFFVAAVLGRAYRMTERRRYSELLAGYMHLCARRQQEDGLFWHGESVPRYWGRGNAFAALGFAEALTYLPGDTAGRDGLVATHRSHLESIIATAAPSGMLRQVLDVRGSYEELSATCMTGYALARGIRLGWLSRALFGGPLERLWKASLARVDSNGDLVDVCTGTGPQPSLGAYLNRTALSGYDDRGGSLASWFAAEMLALATGDGR